MLVVKVNYYYVSGKEDFFKSLSIKLVECQQKTFLPSKTYEERNGLAFMFQVVGDRSTGLDINSTGLDIKKEPVSDAAEGSTNGAVTIGANNDSASVRKNEHAMSSKPLPPRSTLRRETGHEVFACKFEVSLKICCDIKFSNWTWINVLASSKDPSKSNDSLKSNDIAKSNDSLKSNDIAKLNDSVKMNGHMKIVSARYVLSMLEGWDDSRGIAIIELPCRVETERRGIYSLD